MTDFYHGEAPSNGSALDNNEWLANDGLLPSQFYDIICRTHEPTPEHKLMAAVLEDALRCWIGRGTWTVERRVRLQQEADMWLFGHFEAPFTLEQVCEYLCHADGKALEPSWIRAELRKLLQNDIRAISPFSIVRHATDTRRSIKANRPKRRNNHCVRSTTLGA